MTSEPKSSALLDAVRLQAATKVIESTHAVMAAQAGNDSDKRQHYSMRLYDIACKYLELHLTVELALK